MKTKLSIVALAAALLFAGLPVASSSAAVSVAIGIAPPLIPVYTQPYAPGPGYIWTPGYWAYSDFGYYWVPGIWVLPPRIGFLWTPGYWGYNGGRYAFYDGYWGPSVGYYGGINYGFGYVGSGYYGGQWVGSTFRYNTAVTRVNRNVITNTYVNNSFPRTTRSRASFNGPGGVKAERPAQQEVPKSKRIAPTREQRTVVEAAQKNPALHAKNNKGRPKADAVESVRSKVNPDRAANGKPARNERQAQGDNRGTEANQAGARNEGRAEKSARPERTKRGEQRANTANQAASEQPKRTEKRSGAQRAERNAAPKAERSRPTATKKADRPQREARPAAKKPTVERSKAPARPRATAQRPQRAPQRQQATMKRRPQSGAVRKAPAQGQQQPEQGKKKKRERPEGR